MKYLKYFFRVIILSMMIYGLPVGNEIMMMTKDSPNRQLSTLEAICVIPGIVGCCIIVVGGILLIACGFTQFIFWVFSNKE